jgi:hypothetical protein
MRVGVAIPCCHEQIEKLAPCLDSIETQTFKPEGVVVYCTSTQPDDIAPDLSTRFSFGVIISTTPEHMTSGQALNAAAALLVRSFGVDIVSFFVANDVMHPQRLEFIRRAFVWLPGRKIVLHDYSTDSSRSDTWGEPYERLDVLKDVCRRGSTGEVLIHGHPSKRVRHGHASVHRSIIGTHCFSEGEGSVDVQYCGRIVSDHVEGTAYIEQPLSRV